MGLVASVELDEELKKPIDASDLATSALAHAEVMRLRQLLADHQQQHLVRQRASGTFYSVSLCFLLCDLPCVRSVSVYFNVAICR